MLQVPQLDRTPDTAALRATGVAPAPNRRRGRQRRRARATVLSAVITLVLMTGGFAAYVQVNPGIRDPLVFIKRDVYAERVAARPTAVRAVVLGSSRSAAAVDPYALAAAVEAQTGRPCVGFNLSAAGAGPVSQLLHVRRLLANGPRPDVAVVECLPAGFAWTKTGPHDASVLKADRLTWDELAVVEKYGFPAGLRDRWMEGMANPWTGFRFQILVQVKPKWRPPELAAGDANRADVERYDGWGLWEPAPPAEVARRLPLVRAKYEPYMREIDFDRPAAEAFRDTIRLLQAAGVQVVVATMPEANVFRGWYPPGLDERIETFLAGLRTEFGVPVLDTRDWLPDAAFADGHHVVRGAAKGFTERLVREGLGGREALPGPISAATSRRP